MNKTANRSGQYLGFELADEHFAINIGKVREVLELLKITRVPGMPASMRGIINLRGNAVPVVDLRETLGLGRTKRTVDTCIIIVEVRLGEEDIVLGALTDSVREVFELADDQVIPTPGMGAGIDTDFLLGMGKREEQFVMLLDVEQVFSSIQWDGNVLPEEKKAQETAAAVEVPSAGM
ncbi:MAG: chemotaxis protein CheW [Desulfovibrionales bacterium]